MGLLGAAAATVLLLANAHGAVREKDLGALLPGWRGWDDIAIGVGHQLSGDYPVAPYRIANRFRRDQDDFLAFRDALLAATARSGIRPAQFWRTIDATAIGEAELVLARRWDDPGRALLLALGFGALGGIAPYLLTWLGVLLAIPVWIWLAVEFGLGARPLAGGALVTLLSASAFVTDLLQLGYSSGGFSFLAIGLVVCLAAYACLGRPKARGLLVRSALAGGLFAWLVAARNASLLTLGAVACTLAVAACRATPRQGQRLALLAAALLLYVTPYAAVYALNDSMLEATLARREIRRKPVQQHDVWITLWQGLGDFDRSKGHAFLDKAGELEAKRHGSQERLSPLSEAIFRKLILRDIRQDPVWYAGILTRRAWATLSLSKLWPWGPRDGYPLAPATHASEGVTDNYYAMVRSADSFRLASRTWEAPVSLLLLPPLLVGLIAIGPRTAARPGARRFLAVMGSAALAALPAPVLITTASAFETQSFVIVHFLGLAGLAQAGWDVARAHGRPLRA